MPKISHTLDAMVLGVYSMTLLVIIYIHAVRFDSDEMLMWLAMTAAAYGGFFLRKAIEKDER
jgi:hypothetical protein